MSTRISYVQRIGMYGRFDVAWSPGERLISAAKLTESDEDLRGLNESLPRSSNIATEPDSICD